MPSNTRQNTRLASEASSSFSESKPCTPPQPSTAKAAENSPQRVTSRINTTASNTQPAATKAFPAQAGFSPTSRSLRRVVSAPASLPSASFSLSSSSYSKPSATEELTLLSSDSPSRSSPAKMSDRAKVSPTPLVVCSSSVLPHGEGNQSETKQVQGLQPLKVLPRRPRNQKGLEQHKQNGIVSNDGASNSMTGSLLAGQEQSEEPSRGWDTGSLKPAVARSPARFYQQEIHAFRKTQCFLISDTHNHAFQIPREHYDFAVCLGDHTTRSTRQEFENFVAEIMQIDTDHLFMIFGNHEYSTDPGLAKTGYPRFESGRVQCGEEYLTRDYASQLCREYGIILLEEGKRVFHLNNGTTAMIYASPYTPKRRKSAYNGYRYKRREKIRKRSREEDGQETPEETQFGRIFDMGAGVDLVFTHGPPEGILDDFGTKPSFRGCADLLEAVASARPRLHCFGHSHAGWGATFVDWDGLTGNEPLLKEKVANTCKPDSELMKATKVGLKKREDVPSLKEKDAASMNPTGCFYTSHCAEDPLFVVKGSHTLFVNAAYEGPDADKNGEKEIHMPVVVCIDLPLNRQSGADVGEPAPLKKPPVNRKAPVSGRTLVSGQSGAFVPPHKRRESTGDHAHASQKSEDLTAWGAANGTGSLAYTTPGLSGPPQTQHHLTLLIRGQAESHQNGSPEARSTSSWGVQDPVRHRYRPVRGSPATPNSNSNNSGQDGGLPSSSTTSPWRASVANQASLKRSNSVPTSFVSEGHVWGQQRVQEARARSWPNGAPGANKNINNSNSSGRPQKSHRGKYGSFDKGSSKDRDVDRPWK